MVSKLYFFKRTGLCYINILEYENQLDIEFEKSTGLCKINVASNIDIKKNSILTTTLHAKNNNIEIASTAIILYMPTEDSLYFSSPLYKSNYILNESVLSIQDSIEILGAENENIILKLEGDRLIYN